MLISTSTVCTAPFTGSPTGMCLAGVVSLRASFEFVSMLTSVLKWCARENADECAEVMYDLPALSP